MGAPGALGRDGNSQIDGASREARRAVLAILPRIRCGFWKEATSFFVLDLCCAVRQGRHDDESYGQGG